MTDPTCPTCDPLVGCIKKECPARRYLIAQCPLMTRVDDVTKHACPDKECVVFKKWVIETEIVT